MVLEAAALAPNVCTKISDRSAKPSIEIVLNFLVVATNGLQFRGKQRSRAVEHRSFVCRKNPLNIVVHGLAVGRHKHLKFPLKSTRKPDYIYDPSHEQAQKQVQEADKAGTKRHYPTSYTQNMLHIKVSQNSAYKRNVSSNQVEPYTCFGPPWCGHPNVGCHPASALFKKKINIQ